MPSDPRARPSGDGGNAPGIAPTTAAERRPAFAACIDRYVAVVSAVTSAAAIDANARYAQPATVMTCAEQQRIGWGRCGRRGEAGRASLHQRVALAFMYMYLIEGGACRRRGAVPTSVERNRA